MLIRSYRRVFDLERRIYRVDRIRLNPGGIPVRGIVYFLALLFSALLVARLPLVGLPARLLPVYVRGIVLPALLAALLAVVRIEGRPFHLAVRGMLRGVVGPSRVVGLWRGERPATRAARGVWRPPPILLVPDGSDARVRRLRYRGPGALLVSVAHERRVRRDPLVALGLRSHMLLRELPGVARPCRGEVILLDRAARISVE